MPTEAELEAMARTVHPESHDACVYLGLKSIQREQIVKLCLLMKQNEALRLIQREISMIDRIEHVNNPS